MGRKPVKQKKYKRKRRPMTSMDVPRILAAYAETGSLAGTLKKEGGSPERVRAVITGELWPDACPELPRGEINPRGAGSKTNPHLPEMIQLRKDGWTHQMIGDKFGVTRARAHQLVRHVAVEKPKLIKKHTPDAGKQMKVLKVLVMGQVPGAEARGIARDTGLDIDVVKSILKGRYWPQFRPDLPRWPKGRQINPVTEARRQALYRMLREEDLTIREMGERLGGLKNLINYMFPVRGLCPCCKMPHPGHEDNCAVGVWKARGRYRHHKGRPECAPHPDQDLVPRMILDARISMGMSLNDLALVLEDEGWSTDPKTLFRYAKGMVTTKLKLDEKIPLIEKALSKIRQDPATYVHHPNLVWKALRQAGAM